jgi:hypothetical protein
MFLSAHIYLFVKAAITGLQTGALTRVCFPTVMDAGNPRSRFSAGTVFNYSYILRYYGREQNPAYTDVYV